MAGVSVAARFKLVDTHSADVECRALCGNKAPQGCPGLLGKVAPFANKSLSGPAGPIAGFVLQHERGYLRLDDGRYRILSGGRRSAGGHAARTRRPDRRAYNFLRMFGPDDMRPQKLERPRGESVRFPAFVLCEVCRLTNTLDIKDLPGEWRVLYLPDDGSPE